MTAATFTSKDNNWQEEATIYWFDMDGEQFGIRECGIETTVLDSDGAPVDYNEALRSRVQRTCIVTDEMRAA
jgi:hypothetical protein